LHIRIIGEDIPLLFGNSNIPAKERFLLHTLNGDDAVGKWQKKLQATYWQALGYFDHNGSRDDLWAQRCSNNFNPTACLHTVLKFPSRCVSSTETSFGTLHKLPPHLRN
jgi:hypothetical protein